jgi:hypothetical protein
VSCPPDRVIRSRSGFQIKRQTRFVHTQFFKETMRNNTLGLRTFSWKEFFFNYTHNISRRTRRKPCPNSALPTTNPTRTVLIFNSGLPHFGRRLTAPAISWHTATFSNNFEVQPLLFLCYLYLLNSSFLFHCYFRLSERTETRTYYIYNFIAIVTVSPCILFHWILHTNLCTSIYNKILV